MRVNVFDSVDILDANEQVFFQKQLEHVKAKTFEVLYPELTFRKVFPISTETNPGADSITYRSYDRHGKAKIMGNGAQDLPRVDVSGKETTIKVRTLGDSYGYTIQEIKAAKMSGTPLDQKRANAARGAIEFLMNQIAYLGDDEFGLAGLFNGAGVPVGDAPNGAWDSSTDPSDILADVNDAFGQVFAGTNGVERPNKLLLPPSQWTMLATTPRSDTSDKSLLTWIIENSPFLSTVNDVIICPECIEAGTDSCDIMAVVSSNPEKMEFEIPEEIMFHPEQPKGIEFIIPVTARCAGLNMYYPYSAYISEGI